MSNRLDQVREKELSTKRMQYAIQALTDYVSISFKDETKLEFIWKGSKVTLYVYSGWHSGKSITDGRGIDNLLKQLK